MLALLISMTYMNLRDVLILSQQLILDVWLKLVLKIVSSLGFGYQQKLCEAAVGMS